MSEKAAYFLYIFYKNADFRDFMMKKALTNTIVRAIMILQTRNIVLQKGVILCIQI